MVPNDRVNGIIMFMAAQIAFINWAAHKMGKNKSFKRANCNRPNAFKYILRHQASKLCGKYTTGTSQCPFVYCEHHTTLPNLRQHIRKYHLEFSCQIFKVFVWNCYSLSTSLRCMDGDVKAKLELKAKYVRKS